MPPSDRLVTVARYDTQGDAQLARARLEDAGISCMLANADQAGLTMMFDPSRSGVQVKVLADRADEARALLGKA
ncbi:MAG: putative signal transducing protein [Salinibacter sp.]